MAKRGSGISSLLRRINDGDWLSTAIDRHLGRKRPERWVKADPTIHPSSLGTPCALEFELGLLGHRPAFKGGTVRVLDNGTDVGKRWARTFRDMGLLVEAEAAARRDDPLYSGSIDVVLQNPVSGQKVVGEVKSINSQGYRRLPPPTADRRANMRQLAAVSPWIRKYCLQITAYTTISGLDGFFLFENKDNQEYRIYWVEPTPEMRAECFEVGYPAVTAQQAFFDGELVPPPFQRTSAQCRACDRSRVCFALQDGDEETWARIREQLHRAGQEVRSDPRTWPPSAPASPDSGT